MDAIQYAKGHRYLTLVYQIEQGCIRLLWIGKDRTAESLAQFFNMVGTPLSDGFQFVCSTCGNPICGSSANIW
jgi:transposase